MQPPSSHRRVEVHTNFREVDLGDLTLEFDCEPGRSFVARGQRSTIAITSDPMMGGGSIGSVLFGGRVGLYTPHQSNTSDTVISLRATDKSHGEVELEEIMPRSEIEALLADDEACKQYVVNVLKEALQA